jgi:hypothetical protein
MKEIKAPLAVFWDRREKRSPVSFSSILKNIPIEELFVFLQFMRGKGRNKYPISEMWEVVYKQFLFSVDLKEICPPSMFSRFLTVLKMHEDLIVKMLRKQIKALYIDSKVNIPFFLMGFTETGDIRYHYVLDGLYGLPVVFNIENRSSDLLLGASFLIEELVSIFPFWDEQILIADDSYDDTSFLIKLWDTYRMKPIIPLKKTKEVIYEAPFPDKNIVFSSIGDVFCDSPLTKEKQKMVYCGFEKERNALKFKCTANYYHINCKYKTCCKIFSGMRISLDQDRRVFLPIPRSSYKFNTLYQKNEFARFFRADLERFYEKFKRYDLEKKSLLCLLFRSFLHGCMQEVLKGGKVV